MPGWHPKIDELLEEPNVKCHRWPGMIGRHLAPIAEIIRTRSSVYCLLNGNTGRIRIPVPCKTAAVFHDLRLIYFPELYGVAETAEFTRLAKTWMPKLDLVITGSQTVKSEIHDFFGIPDERVIVVSEGSDHGGCQADSDAMQDIQLGFPFFLTVNPSDVRKNLFRTLDAFAMYLTEHPDDREVKLVIAGVISEAERFSAWQSEHPEIRDRVITIGYVSESYLASLYRTAIASIYMSLYEGFGIPIIESFRSRCPVIVADIPVFREVAIDVACFVDPCDSKKLSAAMWRIRKDPELRHQLIDRGTKRANTYSWSKSAAVALEALLRL